jgi:hypothetical protein
MNAGVKELVNEFVPKWLDLINGPKTSQNLDYVSRRLRATLYVIRYELDLVPRRQFPTMLQETSEWLAEHPN